MRTIRDAVSLGCCFGMGVALTVVGFTAFAPRSLLPFAAATPPSCITNGDEGQEGTIEDAGNSTSNDIRGTRANTWVSAGPTACQRISSVYVFSQNYAGVMEFGYVIGYSICSDQTYTNPTLFSYWSTTTGNDGCTVWGNRHPAEVQYDTFQVSDQNGNGYWGSYINGEALQPNGINLDFTKGWSIAGMERGGDNDNGYARWNELQEFHDGNDWSRWDDANNVSGHLALNPPDPDYHYNRINAYTVSIEPD